MNLFQKKDCMVTTYALAAVAKLGIQALDWDPLILRDAFQGAFGCKLSQKGFDKLQAGLTMIGTNLFEVSVQAFLACTAACADKPVQGDKLCYVNLKDCCWSVFCWKELLGYDQKEDPERFSSDIITYIQGLMDLRGISKLPDFMDFAQLPDDKLTAIQQTLVTDADAFQAYTRRQDQSVNDIKAYIKDKQAVLVSQLQEMQKILNN